MEQNLEAHVDGRFLRQEAERGHQRELVRRVDLQPVCKRSGYVLQVTISLDGWL
jgi:hypothetical protein